MTRIGFAPSPVQGVPNPGLVRLGAVKSVEPYREPKTIECQGKTFYVGPDKPWFPPIQDLIGRGYGPPEINIQVDFKPFSDETMVTLRKMLAEAFRRPFVPFKLPDMRDRVL